LARILVTGAAGFIGRALCRSLVERGHKVRGVTRGRADPIAGVELRPIGDVGPRTSWSGHLDRTEIVIHLADRGVQDVAAQAAAALARAAADSGAQRLVQMSSIRAMGEATRPGAPFRVTDVPSPQDAYGRAKLAIERSVQRVAQRSGLDLVILRPPLVYGPGVRANFRALIKLVASGLPLPFAGIDNRRSLIFLDNLIDLVERVCVDRGAAGRIFLARDGLDLSTAELVRALAAALGRRARLFTVPQPVFAPLRRLPGIGPLVGRLTLSLQADDSATRQALDWSPPISVETGLAATVRALRHRS
jgi:nucleoside-diphosphate-sugar epimerase